MGRSDKGRKVPPSGAPAPSKTSKPAHVRFVDPESSKYKTRDAGAKTPGPSGSGKERSSASAASAATASAGAEGTKEHPTGEGSLVKPTREGGKTHKKSKGEESRDSGSKTTAPAEKTVKTPSAPADTKGKKRPREHDIAHEMASLLESDSKSDGESEGEDVRESGAKPSEDTPKEGVTPVTSKADGGLESDGSEHADDGSDSDDIFAGADDTQKKLDESLAKEADKLPTVKRTVPKPREQEEEAAQELVDLSGSKLAVCHCPTESNDRPTSCFQRGSYRGRLLCYQSPRCR